MEKSIGFKIENYSIENDSITVRPYSLLFKNPIDTYPIYNVTISNLDTSKNILVQIGSIMQPIVESILANEPAAEQTEIENVLNPLLGKYIVIPAPELPEPVNTRIKNAENVTNINFVS